MDGLVKELTIEMLPEGPYKQIAEAIGPENFYRLAEVVGGATIYIPKPESLTRPVRDAHIKAEFNGYNHPELARKYGVTERWVRQLCGPGQTEGQIELFELLEGMTGTDGNTKPNTRDVGKSLKTPAPLRVEAPLLLLVFAKRRQ